MRKMRLVPEDVFSMLQRREVQKSTPELDAVVRIDHEMERILKNKDLPLEQKMAQYTAALNEYKNFREKVGFGEKPAAEATIIQTSENTGKDTSPVSLISAIPKSHRGKAEKLLDHLKKSGRVTWDKNNSLIVDGKLLPNTNLQQLVYDSVAENKKSQPVGWREFTKTLNEIGVPESIRGNKRRRREFSKENQPPDTATNAMDALPGLFWDAT